jgi:hypothetical protein
MATALDDSFAMVPEDLNFNVLWQKSPAPPPIGKNSSLKANFYCCIPFL